jgi:hypothetical protein
MVSHARGCPATAAGAENLLIEKEQRGQRLVLPGRGNVAHGRKIGQKCRYLHRPELAWMALSGKKDEPPYPVEISLLVPAAVVQPADRVAGKIEKPRSCRSVRRFFHDVVIHNVTPVPREIAREPCQA